MLNDLILNKEIQGKRNPININEIGSEELQ